MSDVLLYVTDTMADWEYGYVVAEINRAAEEGNSPHRLRTVADGSLDPVTTKGTLKIVPELVLADLEEDDVAMLVLPGADTWEDGHAAALGLAGRLIERGTPVAAICGATYGLARAGYLDDRPHTSNAPEFLAASGYRGAAHYRKEPVVDDGTVITATATLPVEFARAVFDRLQLWNPRWRAAWHGLFTTNEPAYFHALMEASRS